MSDIRVELSAVAVRGEPPVKRNKRQARGLVREISKKPRLGSLLLALLATRLARPSEERCGADIECYPGIPYHRHLLWKAARYAGVKLLPYRGEGTRRVRRPRLRLYWPDTTVAVAGVPPPPECWRRGALNGGTGEESKRRVEQAFAGMFGYDLAVDPTVHEGPCVAKSDRVNGAHDGRVLLCPIAEADPALAYEVLIDNRVDEETVIDFRVPVVGGRSPSSTSNAVPCATGSATGTRP